MDTEKKCEIALELVKTCISKSSAFTDMNTLLGFFQTAYNTIDKIDKQ